MNGETFSSLMKRAGLNQKQLSDCLSVSVTSINRWAADQDRPDKVTCPPTVAFFLLVWGKLRPDERSEVDASSNLKEDLALIKSLTALHLLRHDELKEIILQLNNLYN